LSGRPQGFQRLLKRAAQLLAVAVAIDVGCWGIAPFETFDVLYLLALAVPVCGLCLRTPALVQLTLALTILAATPWLRAQLGYGPLLPEAARSPWPVWRRALVDGWFPIFPWLSVSLLGSLLGRARMRLSAQQARSSMQVIAGALLLAGGLAFWWWPPQLVTRQGYSELFYPPTLPYLALALAAVLAALLSLEHVARQKTLGWLALLGQSSLFLYWLHVAAIAFVLDEWFKDLPLPHFLGLYALFSLALWVSALLWRRLWRGLRQQRAADPELPAS
jgi:uncharacterized membrane protein